MNDTHDTNPTPKPHVSIHLPRDVRDRLKVLAALAKMPMCDLIKCWVQVAEARESERKLVQAEANEVKWLSDTTMEAMPDDTDR